MTPPRKFRYIAVAPGRVDGKHVKRLGTAVFLFDFLIDHQTDPEGRVNYGKPISYPWIEERFENAPPRRTLRRWMTTLRREDYIRIRRSRYGESRMIVTIAAPKKWPAPAQLPLFPSPEPLSITSAKAFGNPVSNLRNSQVHQRPYLAAVSGQKWPLIPCMKNQREEKPKTAARAAAPVDCREEKNRFEQLLRAAARGTS